MERRQLEVNSWRRGMVRRAGNRVAGVAMALLFVVVTGGCGGEAAPPVTPQAHVVLLHGLGRSDLSMLRVESALTERGYRVRNVDYPSTEYSIEQLARKELAPALEECCIGSADTVHFVTHSMGGIVLRYYLAENELENLGRVVMLSPPNQGSEVADWVSENPLFESILGPSAEQLGTDSSSLVSRLGPVEFEVGIITGNRTLNPLFSRIIPGADDGKVAVERAKVEGMADFLVVPHTHTYIMMSENVIDQVAYFLEHGRFRRDSAQAACSDCDEE